MTDIRGIHYEISLPVLNRDDGYYYQRVRQVDNQGNLVGTGDQLIRLPNRGSSDGQYEPSLDLLKLGKAGGDVGAIGYGILKRNPGAAARGVFGFVKDINDGFLEDYKSWPGTDKPWEYGDIPALSGGGYDPSGTVLARPAVQISPMYWTT
jgi:hypothetical protein